MNSSPINSSTSPPFSIISTGTSTHANIKNQRVFVPHFRGDAYVGNYVRYRSHCDPLTATIKIGRLSKIIHYGHFSELFINEYIRPNDIPTTCRFNIPGLRHEDLMYCAEVLASDNIVKKSIEDLVSFAFVFPAKAVTDPDSSFHPQGMVNYYVMRFK